MNETTRTPAPSLAAALIVRDEAAHIGACLRSLAGVVDEVHVHDTGSTDDTPAVAAGLGAQVSVGPWTGDFAAARNAALDGWTADWVLSVDADEVVVADPPALRRLLSSTPADVLRVAIANEQQGTVYHHQADRLFRPAVVRWEGRAHEQLTGRARPPRVATVAPGILRIDHRGYADDGVRRAKAARNVALLRAVLADLAPPGGTADPERVARTMVDLGRSLVGADQLQEAAEAFEAVRELFPGTPEWVEATEFLARLVLGAGMDETCVVLVRELRGAGGRPAYCDWLEAQALAQLGDAPAAQRLLAGVDEVVDGSVRRQDPIRLRELKDLVDGLVAAGRG